MRIGGVQKTTLVDYPGKVAATVFTQGCNFRCPYCHNPELVLPEQFIAPLDNEWFFTFLESRRGKLEGVCITGGEPTIQPRLREFIRRIKEMGFLVKLDSNGSLPRVLQQILDEGNVDYVAMDLKAPLNKYAEVTKGPASISRDIEQSIDIIMNSGIDYEFRTTVVKPLLNISDFIGMGIAIKGAKRYFLQNYQSSKNILGDNLRPFTDDELSDCREVMLRYVQEVGIRS